MLRSLSIIITCVALSTTAQAQTDTIYRTDGKSVRGKIAKESRGAIQVRVGNKTETIPAGLIVKIRFQGDPPGLTKGREFALDDQFEQALEELRSTEPSDFPRDIIKADAEYYQIYSETNLALAGKADRKAAASRAFRFVRGNSNSWHFYNTARLLGHLAKSLGQYDQAIRYYESLAKAASGEVKIESKYLTGTAKLAAGDYDAAIKDFELVAGVDVQSPTGLRLKTLAKAGQAEAMAKAGRAEQALAITKDILEDLDTLDLELAARVYNARGTVFQQQGDDEGAILAYLHTDLMFSSVAPAHAEALKQLATLWTKVGKPDRAATAQQQLRTRYPGFGG